MGLCTCFYQKSKLNQIVKQDVILTLKLISKQVEGQVVDASKIKVTVANVFQVMKAKFVVVTQFIEVSTPTVSPAMALVTVAATGSVTNIIIVITIMSELFE
ncbi:MAG: hypothetical protein EZS28_026010 [Streblomastix strix]|uniref:Uncharacterized protein n=1 Tax=Streblomastix strix TaxID=222440 RepID=A0A5J4V7N9_9EUKA|nr:MAG: hypothetical protein EZS28_026010 [Streblomastix strix]